MHDVIVVGGGPTGFVTALGLAQAGVDVLPDRGRGRAIDREPARLRSITGRCSTGSNGSASARRPSGSASPRTTTCGWCKATGERIEYDISVVGRVTPFPYNIQLGQHQLAKICQAPAGGTEQRRGPLRRTRFTGLTQDADGVTVRSSAGEPSCARSWVVGADGAGSDGAQGARPVVRRDDLARTVRRHQPPPRLRKRRVPAVEHGDRRPQWGAVIVKITRDGLWRCTYMEDAALPEETLRRAHPGGLSAPAAGSKAATTARRRPRPTRCTSAAPPRFRKGRVVLAGDAAHVTNPTGGFGLTTGLFDAYALWPTLAAVVLDGADPALLDRWAEERRAVFLERTEPAGDAPTSDFVFHANGGGAELEAALEGMRAMARDPEVRLRAADVHQGAGDGEPGGGASPSTRSSGSRSTGAARRRAGCRAGRTRCGR